MFRKEGSNSWKVIGPSCGPIRVLPIGTRGDISYTWLTRGWVGSQAKQCLPQLLLPGLLLYFFSEQSLLAINTKVLSRSGRFPQTLPHQLVSGSS